jgi:hypothetical protein
MVAIYHAYHVHQTLRVTPEMAAERMDDVWILDELVGLLGTAETKPA